MVTPACWTRRPGLVCSVSNHQSQQSSAAGLGHTYTESATALKARCRGMTSCELKSNELINVDNFLETPTNLSFLSLQGTWTRLSLHGVSGLGHKDVTDAFTLLEKNLKLKNQTAPRNFTCSPTCERILGLSCCFSRHLPIPAGSKPNVFEKRLANVTTLWITSHIAYRRSGLRLGRCTVRIINYWKGS